MVVILIIIAGYGVYRNQSEKETLSNIMVANIEALASDESNYITIECIYGGCVINPWYDCWVYEMGFPKTYCQDAYGGY